MAARGRSWRASSSIMAMAIVGAVLLLQVASACGGHGHGGRRLKSDAARPQNPRKGGKGSTALPVLSQELLMSSDKLPQHLLPVNQADLPMLKVETRSGQPAAGGAQSPDTIIRTSVDMSRAENAEQAAQIAKKAELPRSAAGRTKRSCGTRDFENDQDRAAREVEFQSDMSRLKGRRLRTQAFPQTINVHYHVIHNGTAGNLAESVLMEQTRVMNEAFAPAGLSFRVASINRVMNRVWFYKCYDGLPEGYSMKRSLRKGTYADLNFYTCSLGDSLDDVPGLLGYAQFPEKKPSIKAFNKDGVVQAYDTLPGVNLDSPFSLGDTAVHEVGHWLGLYHVFQGGCNKANNGGDYVADTPASLQHDLCDATMDSCPNMPGNDPIHNYMAYTADACLGQFTPGQMQRMQEYWMVYRAKYSGEETGGCEDEEELCAQWAGLGFCGPQYIHPSMDRSIRDMVCRKSCNTCGCADVDPVNCAEWARAPEQYCSPGWLHPTTRQSIRDSYCRASCNTCGCLDYDSQCADWAAQGLCKAHVFLSREDQRSIPNAVCRKSCGTCEAPVTHLAAGAVTA